MYDLIYSIVVYGLIYSIVLYDLILYSNVWSNTFHIDV